MKRVGFIFKVLEEKIEEYKKHHESVWPEMLLALKKHGWRNYSIYLKKDGTLFGYFEAEESFEKSLEGMASEKINQKWQEFMQPYFEDIDDKNPDEAMLELEEVFHTD
ncbi:MAG: L-rhamnose mutarotase [Dehalococcoidia bacterium]|nr:L-rhamnose mutarotase [Dehalococcoidia bacterium]|tara:strand:+ start:393 stop:716 length:324 start_codon:yes stop_codon:yes gene_type:complete